jgi:hypothetical protein
MKSKHILIMFVELFFLLQFAGCSRIGTKDLDQQNTIETTVVNLKTNTYDEYIGRGTKSYTHMLTVGIQPGIEGWLGNPHPIGWCSICRENHTRTECISAFRVDFVKATNSNVGFRMCVLSLKGKRLGCYCKPEDCHGDVIKEYIESQ